eukprot:m.12720 g.12720  ORF g.12720 m.12720 type:complete len:68 (-) comp4720_c1_seq1:95-298(-)
MLRKGNDKQWIDRITLAFRRAPFIIDSLASLSTSGGLFSSGWAMLCCSNHLICITGFVPEYVLVLEG